MRVGVTGHRRLPEPQQWDWVRERLDTMLAKVKDPLVCVSSLACGADSVVAEVILARGGRLDVILPFKGYEALFTEPADLQVYRRLLAKAAGTTVAAAGGRGAAFLAAGQAVADACDVLVAIWDGMPSTGVGDPADVVDYAQFMGRRVLHFDPFRRTIREL